MLLHAAFRPDQYAGSDRFHEETKSHIQRPAVCYGDRRLFTTPLTLAHEAKPPPQQVPRMAAKACITGRCGRKLSSGQLAFHRPRSRYQRSVHAWLELQGVMASEGRRAAIFAHSAVSERTARSAPSCVRPSMNVTYGFPARCNSTRYPPADSATRNSSCNMQCSSLSFSNTRLMFEVGGGTARRRSAVLRMGNVQQTGRIIACGNQANN